MQFLTSMVFHIFGATNSNTPFTRSSKRQASIEQLYMLAGRSNSLSQLHRVNGV